jgi:4-amino-4-deoxy-L-arabinose transferase-like glycosyltransferase
VNTNLAKQDRQNTIIGLGLLAVLLVVNIASAFSYTLRQMPLVWDEAGHLSGALEYSYAFSHFQFARGWFTYVSSINSFVYPPLVHVLGGIVLFVFGESLPGVSSFHSVYLVLLIVTTFEVGRRLHSVWAGLLAALLVSAFPIIVYFSRRIWLDVAATAWVSATLACLLASVQFSRLRHCLLMGMGLGLGMLSKSNYVWFVAVPLAFQAIVVFKRDLAASTPRTWLGWVQLARQRHWLHLGLGLMVAFGVGAPWYLLQWYRGNVFMAAVALTNTEGASLFSLESLTFYIRTFVTNQLELGFTFAFLVALWGFGQSKLPRPQKWLLILSVLLPLLALTLTPHKTNRQSMGLLPFVAVIMAVGLLALRPRWLRVACVAATLLLGLNQLVRPILSPPPESEEWVTRAQQSLHIISQSLPNPPTQKLTPRATIGLICDHPFINGLTFNAYARLLQLPVAVSSLREKIDRNTTRQEMLAYDFLVTKSDWVPPEKRWAGANAGTLLADDNDAQVLEVFNRFKDDYKLMTELPLPDASTLLVYRRKA